jgi:hypothetical protein
MIHSSLIFCYSYHNIKIQIRKGLERRKKMEIPEREKSRDKKTKKYKERSTPKAPSTYEVCWMVELNPYIHTDKSLATQGLKRIYLLLTLYIYFGKIISNSRCIKGIGRIYDGISFIFTLRNLL